MRTKTKTNAGIMKRQTLACITTKTNKNSYNKKEKRICKKQTKTPPTPKPLEAKTKYNSQNFECFRQLCSYFRHYSFSSQKLSISGANLASSLSFSLKLLR